MLDLPTTQQAMGMPVFTSNHTLALGCYVVDLLTIQQAKERDLDHNSHPGQMEVDVLTTQQAMEMLVFASSHTLLRAY